MRDAPSSGRILPQLDALRGVAILAVFAQHLGDRFLPMVRADVERALPGAVVPWILTVLHHAWWGVDLFFVLSGFSLALGYLRAFDADKPAPSARAFFLRRAARIFPAFAVALVVTVAAHPAVLRHPSFGAALAAHAALLQGYVVPGGVIFIGAAWSLTTEAHFYVLLPALARPLLARGDASWRRFAWGLGLCAAVWAARAALHGLMLEPGVHDALLEATQRRWIVSRLDQFVLGALVAALAHEIKRSRWRDAAQRLAPFGMLGSTALLVVAFKLEGALYLTPDGSWPYALVSLATAGLVLSASCTGPRMLAIIAPGPLRALGVVSYGVFLYHELVLGVVGARMPGARGEPTWTRLGVTAAVALVGSAAAGVASWLLVEQPCLRWLAKVDRARPSRVGALETSG